MQWMDATHGNRTSTRPTIVFVAAAGAEAPQSVSESVLVVPTLAHHVRAPLPRALSAGVFTVAMDLSVLPPFAQRTHKGWGTRSCVNTQLENAVVTRFYLGEAILTSRMS